MSMTLKQSQRYQYIRLCQRYNAEADNPTTPEFVALCLRLHAAKGWEHIPKYMTTATFVRRQGKNSEKS